MPSDLAVRAALAFYALGWQIATPWLRFNHRLAEGFEQRTLRYDLPAADLWIQAASAGESYLAAAIIENLTSRQPLSVLVTTHTRQGMDILQQAIGNLTAAEGALAARAAYFPFDRPAIMQKAVRQVRPKVMVLLETEIWPALLAALKQHGCRTVIINGRMTPKSLSGYRICAGLFKSLRPERVLAISENDALRFASLFGEKSVTVMPNIKFDRLDFPAGRPGRDNPLAAIVPPGARFVVLGSVRREEETAVQMMMGEILQQQPAVIIGLFPRHMHRIQAWQKKLDRHRLPWVLRSRLTAPAAAGTVLLWDTFGELAAAYRLARAVFVGGSLAPLGGQNFLEPLSCGVVPVIGPSWENFFWVGPEIVSQGLVRIAADWQAAARILVETLRQPPAPETVRYKARQYLRQRRGGTAIACDLITAMLGGS